MSDRSTSLRAAAAPRRAVGVNVVPFNSLYEVKKCSISSSIEAGRSRSSRISACSRDFSATAISRSLRI
ncbi:MAG TPA: hypothetical protein VFT96_13670, partial [Gemmatimonadaceae bacterium]|nr:hypothetical protein [Gemmatimonadaceae bacterium]